MSRDRFGLGLPILLLAGCAFVGQASPSVVAPTESPTATATTSPPAVPTSPPTDSPTTPPTEAPSPGRTSEPTAHPTSPPPQGNRPPDGLLESAGERVAGSLGSFCWNTCRDGPTAPKGTLPELSAPEDELVFAMENGILFYEWYAHYSSGSNSTVTELGRGCCWAAPDSPLRPPGLDVIHFPAPPPGDWVVHVSVWFEWGDAFYAWRVKVPG